MIKKLKLFSLLTLIAATVLSSGCSDEKLLLSYSSKNNSINKITSFVSDGNTYKCGLLSSGVCVIPENKISVPSGADFSSQGVLLVNADTNQMVLSKNIYNTLYPASLTKLATALVCLRYGNLDDTVTVSYAASHITEAGAKLCFLQEGDKIDLRTLLTSFLVYSGNDAGIAIAEHISGSEAAFAKLMNRELKSLGAVDTHFVNSHGLPNDDHYTTVYDMYLVMNELIKYDEFNSIAAIDSYTAQFSDASGKPVKKVYENTNKYLIGERKLPSGVSIIGSKTGTTAAAGCCLVLAVNGINNQRYIAVIMKSRDSNVLYKEMSKVLEYTK